VARCFVGSEHAIVNGDALEPVPPVTPVGMGKSTRGVQLKSIDDVDEL
jgi:hypothetical protein